MANEADSKDRKRRRKKTGLRVPSDNVPRRASQADSGGVVEDSIDSESSSDPQLAVSLASAFGASERTPAPADDEDSGPAVRVEGLAGAHRAATGDSVDIAFDDEDSGIRDPTNGMGDLGIARPVSQSELEDALEGKIEDISSEVELVPEGPRTDEIEAVEEIEDLDEDADDGDGADDADDADIDAPGEDAVEEIEELDERPTALMPALTEEDVARHDAEVAAARARAESQAEPPDADGLSEPTLEGPPAEAVGGRVVPGDSSDSGELLTDDLIEEYEAGSSAELPAAVLPQPLEEPNESTGPVTAPTIEQYAQRAATVLEPVEEIAPSDVVEVDSGKVESPAEAKPTPPPAPPKTAPPVPRSAAPVTVRPKPPPAPPPAAVAAVVQQQQQQPAAAPKRKGKPWFEEIFDEDYLRTLPFLTPQATQKQAKFVIEALGLEPGSNVLDLGCGYGRHAMELAARGNHVVGLDSSLPLLIRGADEAQRRGLTINFVHGDMRELTFESQFDGAYCLFGTFGYFDDETNKKTAIAVARALKPGGRFVVEVLNRDYLIGDLPSRVWWEGDGCVVLEEVEFNYFSSRIVSSRSVVFDDGRQLEQEISMRAYSLHELGKLLHAAGFRIIEISGSMDTRGRFFGAHSREIVVVCETRRRADGDAAGSGNGNGNGDGDDGVGDGHDHTEPGTGS
jgi:ubiquinone/menaquinone biosynthesis C-methylase UbiE